MRTLSRADFFRLVVGSLGGAMLLSACGDDSDDDGEDTSAGGNDDDDNAGQTSGGNDSGQTSQDAGMVAQDSGAAPTDAGLDPMQDAGTQGPTDAGPPDAGMGKACTTGAKIGTISGTHKHSLMIPPADVTAAVGKTYTITDGHNHQITLTTAQMQMVKAGMSVMVTSTENNGHTHYVQILCA